MDRNARIRSLMTAKKNERDLEWLKRSLQAAIEVEMSTIPPYLLAYWSIKDPFGDVSQVAASSILEIVQEEMLHLGLACNMLVAVGGDPDLTSDDAVPKYPGRLPGEINPSLEVSLEGLSAASLKVFMAIEFPEGGPIAFREGGPVSTIGEFYSRIQETFEDLDPELGQERQRTGGFVDQVKLQSLADVQKAIQLIKHQGEGSKESPEENPNDNFRDLAHYYRFGEIAEGRLFVKDEATGLYGYTGDRVDFPEVWRIDPVPAGGYPSEGLPEDVRIKLEAFDRQYSQLLRDLQAVWQPGAPANALNATIGAMHDLTGSAMEIVSVPIPGAETNFAPCFRYVEG